MHLKNDLIRIYTSIFVFSVILWLVSNIHDHPYMSLYETIHLNCLVVLIGSIYLFIYILIRRGMHYVSKYKPPFTFFYIAIHVYGLGWFMFVFAYCLFYSTIYCTLMCLIGLSFLHFDDLLDTENEVLWIRIVKFISAITAITVVLITVLGQWDNIEIGAIFTKEDLFQFMFIILLPIVMPITFHYIRLTKYCTHFSDMVLDLVQYAVPFACIISGILLTTFHSCLSPKEVGHVIDDYNIIILLILPIFVMIGLYIMLLFVLTKNTWDVIITLCVAVSIKHVVYHSQEGSAVWCFLGADLVLLFRMIVSYFQYLREQNDNKVRLDSSDTEAMQHVPISDTSI